MVKGRYVETGRLFPTDLGSPQGSAITNYLQHGTGWSQIQIKKKYHKTKRMEKHAFQRVNFIRYAAISSSGESRHGNEYPDYPNFYQREGLELSEEKTVITISEDGFDFSPDVLSLV